MVKMFFFFLWPRLQKGKEIPVYVLIMLAKGKKYCKYLVQMFGEILVLICKCQPLGVEEKFNDVKNCFTLGSLQCEKQS